MRAILLVGLTFAFNLGFSQNPLKLRGKVLDEQTGKPLPFVNIFCENCNTSTSANENGEFEIYTKQFPIQLIFSFIGYDRKELYIEQQTDYFEVNLRSGTILLSEVVINGVKDVNYVKSLLLSAYKKAKTQAAFKSFA
ncbi:MAG: carboxypeptidase-like regulatory domain-containing protein, partial [Ferruginibacter sp.]|nr:carboxypeptidase-like regulatory domain-containing protein [Cytophagales bacterium]